MMEGIFNNPIVYELTSEMAWQNNVALGQWVDSYQIMRYGKDIGAGAAWQMLLDTSVGGAYSATASQDGDDYAGIICGQEDFSP